VHVSDTELRGVVLRRYYDRRRDGKISFRQTDFPDIPVAEIHRISKQLSEHALIEWKGIPETGTVLKAIGSITAFGVDVIEGTETPPLSITFDQWQITVIGSHNQIGDGNIQDVKISLEKLIAAINGSTASDGEKDEAKGRLKRFLEHPLVTSIAGGLASVIK